MGLGETFTLDGSTDYGVEVFDIDLSTFTSDQIHMLAGEELELD